MLKSDTHDKKSKHTCLFIEDTVKHGDSKELHYKCGRME